MVDSDDPIIAPKERDLMFMGGSVGNKPQEKELFYEQYGKTEVNRTLLS
jgi:spectinomycin phosphotransferase